MHLQEHDEMARRGRKRNLDKPRQPNGQSRVRSDLIVANPYVLARRLALGKDVAADADVPLSVMLFRGLLDDQDIRDPGERRREAQLVHDAGMAFAALYWRLHGKPFGRVANLLGVHGREAGDPIKALQDERRFNATVRSLDGLGRNARRLVLDCCAHLQWPATTHQAEQIRRGLIVVHEVERPRISDAEKDMAKLEWDAA